MRAYNLVAVETTVGISTKEVIILGEEGRGRKRAFVKCPRGLENGDRVTVSIPKSLVGVPAITAGDDGDLNWVARICTDGAYIRGANGNVRWWTDRPQPTVVARGYGAFGDAGRTGNWDDFVLIVPIGAVLRVKPTRADAYFLYFGGDEVFKYSAEEAELEDIPTSTDLYERL